MKLIQSFNQLLENEVNLNKTRVDRIKNGIETVSSFIKNSDTFSDLFTGVTPQGSFRQKTIIKPVSVDQDFDVDVLFNLMSVKEWEPKDYLEKLHQIFKNSDRYKGIVDRRGKTRCVTLDYESDFHIDIVPCITVDGKSKIMNKSTNQLEDTDGDGYAQWFAGKNQKTGNDYLVKVVRLVKYMRDIKQWEIKSILLTTILGAQVNDADVSATQYPDLPTAFRTLFNRLNSFLQMNVVMPVICNPVLTSESFNRHWDQEKYNQFRDKIKSCNEAVNLAFDADSIEDSEEQWKKVFEDAFRVISEDEEKKESVADQTLLFLADSDHKQSPPWPAHISYPTVAITCRATGRPGGPINLSSNGTTLMHGYNLTFNARISTHLPLPYNVYWQVVNTGEQAAQMRDLRGEIMPAKNTNSPLQHTETTKYTGKHWVECFVVKEGLLVARSNPFYINVVNTSFRRNQSRRKL